MTKTAAKLAAAQKSSDTGASKPKKAKPQASGATTAKRAGPGRPSMYSPALAALICEQLASGMPLTQICAAPGMPDRGTVDRWANEKPEFAAQRARAREAQAETLLDEMADIETKTLAGTVHPVAARAVLSSMQWRAEKMAPKKFGAKLAIGQAEELGPVQVTVKRYSDA